MNIFKKIFKPRIEYVPFHEGYYYKIQDLEEPCKTLQHIEYDARELNKEIDEKYGNKTVLIPKYFIDGTDSFEDSPVTIKRYKEMLKAELITKILRPLASEENDGNFYYGCDFKKYFYEHLNEILKGNNNDDNSNDFEVNI